MTIVWFHRFADIPGVEYAPRFYVDRQLLRGHDASPRVTAFEFDGRRRESLMWPDTGGGGGSASPAQQYAGPPDSANPEMILRNLYESLELPGEPANYHFAISSAARRLWELRRDEPTVLAWIEELYWLDVRFVEAMPDAVRNEYSEEREFVGVGAYGGLVGLYEREGRLADALAVAMRSEWLAQGDASRQRLEEAG